MRLGKARKKKPTYCGRTRHAKIRYRSLKDAKGARSALARKTNMEARVYGCVECGGYHLTTSPQHEYGNPRTVWKPSNRGISSEEGEYDSEEEQDERG